MVAQKENTNDHIKDIKKTLDDLEISQIFQIIILLLYKLFSYKWIRYVIILFVTILCLLIVQALFDHFNPTLPHTLANFN